MKELIKKIRELESISAELEPSEQGRDEYMRQVHGFANDFINQTEKAKTYSGNKVVRQDLILNLKKNPMDFLLKVFSDEVAGKGINAASGGHLGYVPGGGIYTSSLADYLAAVTNEYAGIYYASPGAVIIENEILSWLKSVFGFPADAAGTLTSGGSVANMIALTAARDHHKIKGRKIEKSVIYLSPQTHHCINKALRIIGLEDIILRYTQTDGNFRTDAANLETMIQKDKADGLNPFMVIANAGTTDTGAVDPLKEMGDVAARHKMWYHIDAAYGGFFILVHQKKELFKGIEMADSLVTDPHKGLFIPYGTGAVLVKNNAAVAHSHKYTATYMQDAVKSNRDLVDPADVSPELSRHFRALRIWLPLQLHGLDPFIACLEEKLLLTEYFREKLAETGFRTGPDPDLSISYFWYPSIYVDENTYNKKLLEMMHKDGSVFFSSTVINNKFVIRMAILSFRTKLKTIDRAVAMIKKIKMKMEKDFNYS